MYLPHAYLLHHFVGLLYRQRVVGQMLLALEYTLLLSQPQSYYLYLYFFLTVNFLFSADACLEVSPNTLAP